MYGLNQIDNKEEERIREREKERERERVLIKFG